MSGKVGLLVHVHHHTDTRDCMYAMQSRAKDDGGGEDLRSWEGSKRERHRLYRFYEEKVRSFACRAVRWEMPKCSTRPSTPSRFCRRYYSKRRVPVVEAGLGFGTFLAGGKTKS